MIVYSTKRLALVAINLLLFILSSFLFRAECAVSSSLESFVFSWPNVSIPMSLLTLYSLVKTLTTKEFSRSYWFDMFCCWSICCLYCYFKIIDWLYIENFNIIINYDSIKPSMI